MLKETIDKLYQRLRLGAYRRIFFSVKEKEGSLSATEAFSADVIHLLGHPTLSQFAQYLGISQPNATYKINNLVQKGYVRKVVSDTDRREVILEAADKYTAYLHEANAELERAYEKVKCEFSSEELALTGRVLTSLLHAMEEKNHD